MPGAVAAPDSLSPVPDVVLHRHTPVSRWLAVGVLTVQLTASPTLTAAEKRSASVFGPELKCHSMVKAGVAEAASMTTWVHRSCAAALGGRQSVQKYGLL